MSNDPYRPYGGPGDDLARLAQQGQARLQAAHQGQDQRAHAGAERNLRTAIGAMRGAPMKRVILVGLVLSLLATIGGVVFISSGGIAALQYMPISFVGFFLSFGLFFLYVFLPPLASRAGVEAERAWVASLPFPIEHYFDILGSEPEFETKLRVELWWSYQGVDAAMLQGIIALMDTQSRVIEVQGSYAEFATGPISGSTGIRINRSYVYRNHRLGKAVHRLVEVVLMPIHQSRPLARVRLSKTI